MSRHPDEILRHALACAHGAIEGLYRSLDPEVTVEDLRQAWGRWLQAETPGGIAGRLASGRRVVSELIMAAISEVANGEPIPAEMLIGEPAVEEVPEPADANLLDEAEAYQASVIAVREDFLAARSEATRLEAELNRARVRFGNAIRRWHQDGASVTRIAAALGMSEDAVGRVVGTPSSRSYAPVLVCSFCARSGRLIAGPSVSVCADCVENAQRLGRGGTSATAVGMRLEVGDGEDRCSFCAKTALMVRFLVEGSGVRICDECLDLCGEIVAEGFDV